MTATDSADDERGLEQKAFDDIDQINLLVKKAIRADMKDSPGKRTEFLHEIHELTKSWQDVEVDDE